MLDEMATDHGAVGNAASRCLAREDPRDTISPMMRGGIRTQTKRRGRSCGFTLVEALVALGVASVAITTLLSGITSSAEIASRHQDRRVAAALASEQLLAVNQVPQDFVWPGTELLANGEPHALAMAGEVGGAGQRTFSPPSTLPTNRRAYRREENLYRKFTWEAYARLPQSDSPYVEVIVVVRWRDAQRENTLTMTEALPASVVAGAPA